MIAENKQEFFEELEKELARMNITDTEEVLTDLKIHFAEGERVGKSEREICMELGNIREIARSFLDIKSSRINSIVAENEQHKKVSLTKPGREKQEFPESGSAGQASDSANGDYVRSYTPEHIAEEVIPDSVKQSASQSASQDASQSASQGASQNAEATGAAQSAAQGTTDISEVIKESKTLSIAADAQIEINSNDVKTLVQASQDNEIHIGAKIEDNPVALKAVRAGGRLTIDLKHAMKLAGLGGARSMVIVELPRRVYDSLKLKSGAGTMSAAGVKANDVSLDLGSGTMTVRFPENFTARSAQIVANSGMLTASNVSADNYKVQIRSGKCDVSGLTGSGSFSVASGMASAHFAAHSTSPREFELKSGKLNVYIPDDTRATLRFNVRTGNIRTECCGASATLMKSGEMPINLPAGESGELLVCTVHSGSMSLKNSSAYTPENPGGLGEAAINFANAVGNVVGNTVQTALGAAKTGLEKGLQQAADNINGKRDGSAPGAENPFRPSDEYRKQGMSGERKSDIPPQCSAPKADKAFSFVDVSGLSPDPQPERLTKEILLDVLLWSWLTVLLIMLTLCIFAVSVALIVAAFYCFFGAHGFDVFKLITRIFLGLGMMSFSSAIACLGSKAARGIAKLIAKIINRHLRMIYNI